MKLQHFLFIMLFAYFPISLVSCSDDNEVTYPTKVKNVKDISYVIGSRWYIFNENIKYKVINSYEDLSSIYDHSVNNSNFEYSIPSPVFDSTYDFDKNTILFFRGESTSGIDTITYELYQTAKKTYEFKVNIKQDLTLAVSHWMVAVLVPKIPADATVTFTDTYSK